MEAEAVAPPNKLAAEGGGAAVVEAEAAAPPNKLVERGGGAAGVEAEGVVRPNKPAKRGGAGAEAAPATPSRCRLPPAVVMVALDAMIET